MTVENKKIENLFLVSDYCAPFDKLNVAFVSGADWLEPVIAEGNPAEADYAVASAINCTKEPSVKLHEVLIEAQTHLTPEKAIELAKGEKGRYCGSRLERLWSHLKGFYKVGVLTLPPTQKARGQFSALAKRFAEGPDVGPIMAAVLKDWDGFGKYVVSQCGSFNYPDQPVVGYFLQHADLAIAFAKAATPPSVPYGGLKTVKVSAPT